ncbi:MAG: threonine aldolase, partial [Sphingobacteriales bacterium]
GIYALQNNIERLKEDHKRAKSLAEIINKTDWIESLMPIDTNILIFKLKTELKAELLVEKLKENNILCFAIGGNSIRMVTHLDFTDEMLNQFSEIILKIKP